MSETLQIEDLIGATLFDRSDARIGEIRQVLRDPPTDQPVWVGVRVGPLGDEVLGDEVLVPLEGADWHASALRAAVSRSSAQSAPPTEASGALTPQEQERLLRHYGIPCVCTPREDIDLNALDDGALSYSVHDDAEDAAPAAR